MPTYKVTDPTSGRTLKLTGDSPPTEEELNEIFSSVGGSDEKDFSTGEMLSNIPESAIEYGKAVTAPIHSPVSTGTSLAELASGAITKGASKILPVSEERLQEEDVQLFDNAAQAIKDRYGSWNNFKRTLEKDPVGVAGDISSILGGGAAALKAGGLAKTAGVVGKVATAVDPIAGPLTAGTAATSKIAKASGLAAKADKALNVMDVAKSKGIDMTLGEATGSPNLQRLETGLERVPSVFGISKYRAKVLDQTNNAIKDFVTQYVADPASVKPGVSNRAYVGSLYENMKNMVKEYQDLPVYAIKTADTARDLLDSYPDIFKQFQNAKTEKIINDILITPKTRNIDLPIKKVGTFTFGTNIKGKVQPKSFDDLWTLRDGLGDMVGQAKKQINSGNLSKEQYSKMSKLFGAVNDDIDKWAVSIGKPEVSQGIKTANEAYKRYVVKYNIVQDAMDKSKVTINGEEMISPAKFSNQIKRQIGKQEFIERQGMKGLFQTNEVEEMAGLSNILQSVKRAGQFMENPPTGDRWGFPAIVAGVTTAGGAQAGATAVGSASLAKFLTTTKAGKNIVLQAAKVSPDSTTIKFLARTALQRNAAYEAGKVERMK